MMKKKIAFLFIFCLITFLEGIPTPVYAQKSDSVHIEMILDRMRELLSSDLPEPGTVQKLMNSMQPDGSWNDIDYRNTRVSYWPVLRHLSNVLPMARSFANAASPLYKNKALAKDIHQSLDFWLIHNFTSENWWYNDIGIPNTLSDILILMNEEMTQDELLRALNQMRGSYIDQTGQNRVWRAGIQLKIGLLEFGKGRTNLLGSVDERIRNASKVLQEEVVVRGKEGIQPDWSFHQHGIQQQFGNYGLSFASTQAKWAGILEGTPFSYTPASIGILRNYILNGLSRVVWNGIMDISGCGRQLSPGSPESKGASVINVLQLMSKADPENAEAYNSYISRLQGKPESVSVFPWNIYFWRSALMVNRTRDAYTSLRMCSRKIQSTESGNGENLLGSHLSDGATFVYQTGKEYENIFPVWDWHRIPGVTSYVKMAVPALSWGGLHNGSDFVGGVSDSAFGAAAMLFRRNGLTAHKSWFWISKGLVCLGAGIHSEKHTDVSTTLNQSILTGKIIVKANGGKKTITMGQELNSSKVGWVYHDHTGYVFLQKGKIHVSADDQEGNWNRVYDKGSKESVHQKVFNLWIDHGEDPESGTYAYAILPGLSEKSLASAVNHLSLRILQNDTTLQAIQDPAEQLTQAIFYRAGKISLDKKTVVRTNAPCMLMAKRSGRELKITISAPPELGKKITLSLSGHYSGENSSYDPESNQTAVIFDLPDGISAGQSTTGLLTLQ